MNFQNVSLSLALFLVLAVTNFALIHPYTRKLWNEIDFLESLLLSSNTVKVKSIVDSVVRTGMKHNDYFSRPKAKMSHPGNKSNSKDADPEASLNTWVRSKMSDTLGADALRFTV